MDKDTTSEFRSFLEKSIIRALFVAYGDRDMTVRTGWELAAAAHEGGLSPEDAMGTVRGILRPSPLVCAVQRKRREGPAYRLTKSGYTFLKALDDGQQHNLAEFAGSGGVLPAATVKLIEYLYRMAYVRLSPAAELVVLHDHATALDRMTCGTVRLADVEGDDQGE